MVKNQKMNKEDFLKDFKQEKLNKNTKEKTKINFSNPFKKKNKEKKNKKKRVWLKIVTNIFMLVIILACSFSIFAVNGFNMIADKDYLNKLDELQKLSEKANGVVNFTPDYLFIQFFAKHSNTIMLFSLIVLVVMIILAFILNMTTFKKGKGE